MTPRKFSLILISLLFSLVISFSTVYAEEKSPTADEINSDLIYQAHVSNIGWMDYMKPVQVAGTEGRSLPVEAFLINSNLVHFKCAAHVRNVGWKDDLTNGQIIGTQGQSLPLEAFQISITDDPDVDIYYRAHVSNFGWLGWAKNGETAGTTGLGLPIEAFQITTVSKGAPAPGDTANAALDISQFGLYARAHVSNLGWMNPVSGGTIGTVGQNLGIEAVEVKLIDPTGKSGIVAQGFLKDTGEQNVAGPNDAIGTLGQARPMEAVRFTVQGPAASVFEVNYRTHVSNIGWLGTTSHGRWAGTRDGALKVEAIDINLVRAGTGASDPKAYKAIDHSLGIIPPGPTSIVINKAAQRMNYYENYDVVVSTNVVTGMNWIDDTRSGDWSVLEKLPNYRTKGPGYDAVVDYWLTLYVGPISGFSGEGTINDRVGIHDADWRTDWSPTAYTYNGSHGCVNTPYNAMKTIYTRIPVGAPVRIR